MSHANPLADYVAHKDAETFARIVEQYQGFIFATCRRKLQDSADIDDAVQETFLRLAQRAAELHSNVGGWLHRCAVNISIDMNRRREVRQRHETRAAGQPVPAGDAQQTLAELREHLDVAMEKLDADARELIIQRFFAGRAQIDLAAEAGVSQSTLSHRLELAIDVLREHLNAMGCGALTAGGAAALLGAMQAEHASAAVAQALTANLMKIGLSGVGGAAAVSALVKLLIALAAVLVVGVGIWFTAGQLSAPTSQSQPVKQPTPLLFRAPAAVTVNPGDGGVAAPPNWQTAQGNGQWAALAGRVTDTGGKPIVGASVQLDGPGPGQAAKTDPQGNYTFRTLGGGSGDYRISIDAAGFLPVVPYARNQLPMQLSVDSQARRDFVLPRGVTVQVLVTDVNGKPLANVSIDANESGHQFGSGLMRKETDAAGIAKLTVPISKNTYIVAGTSDGYAPAHEMIHPDSADLPQRVKLVMQPGLIIKGVAICSDKKPAVGWSINAQPDWWASGYIPEESPVAKDGSFTLTDVGAGQYNIWLWRDHSGTSVGTMVFPPATQPIRVDLPMASPSSMVKATGRIRFVGGRPEQLNIQVVSLSGDRDSDFIQPDIQMGPSGKGVSRIRQDEAEYTFRARPGFYLIRFESLTTEAASIDRIQLPGNPPVVTLNVIGKPHLTGTVSDAKTGEPITHFAVRVRKLETVDNGANYVQDVQWTQVSNPEGRFDIACVGPGIYQAQASTSGYAWLWCAPVRLEKKRMTQDVELRLTPGGSLRGHVVDPQGHPVGGVRIMPVVGAVKDEADVRDYDEPDADAAITDAAGRFTLPHLSAGNEKLKVIDANFAPLIGPPLKIVEGNTTDAGTISLHLGGTVEGTVYDSAGKPLAGAGVQFEDSEWYHVQEMSGHGRLASVTTDEAGRYRVEHLAEQPTWINLADGWNYGGVIRRVVRPIDGKTAHLDFGGTMPVRGRLIVDGQALANKDVELAVDSADFGPVIVRGSTDAIGKFTFFGPPPGHYTLFCESLGRGSDQMAVREVDVGDQPIDLGAINRDVGDVIIRITADDPADLAHVEFVSVVSDVPAHSWERSHLSAAEEADHWRAKGVRAGHLWAEVALKDMLSMEFRTSFERKPNAAETVVTLHLPRITASLKLVDAYPVKADSTQPPYVHLRNADMSVDTNLACGANSAPSKLPPGTYRVISLRSDQPRADIDPIVLHDGESREIHGNFAKLEPNAPIWVEVSVWSADGILVTSRPRLIDAKGNLVESFRRLRVQTIFDVPPGHFRAVVDRPGGQPFVQEIDVPHRSSPDTGHGRMSVDIVLPPQ